MEQPELDLAPHQVSVEQTSNLVTQAKKSLVSDARHPINVHLLEDGLGHSVLERANVTEATSSTQNAAQNETLLNPRIPVFTLQHTNMEGYEPQAFLPHSSHDNAIDIVESDDEHLELKQSANLKISEPAKMHSVREDLKQPSGTTNLQNECYPKKQGQPKRKRDTSDRSSPNFAPLVSRSHAPEDKITSIVDSETKVSVPILSPDQQFNSNNKQSDGIQNVNGVVYNDRGYEICGHMNQHNKPCQRIGNCPFHGQSLAKRDVPITKATLIEERNDETRIEPTLEEPLKQVDKETQQTGNHFNQELHPNEEPTPDVTQNPEYFRRNTFPGKKNEIRTEVHQSENGSVKKVPFKQGWSREEHIRFLIGLSWYGKGAWKEISSVVVTRSPTQIQSHAQKYFLRQRQPSKNKKSIHDITMDDLQEMSADTKQSYLLQSQRQQNTSLASSAPFPAAPPQIAKDVSSSTQQAPEVRAYPNTAPYPVNQYPAPTHYQPQGPSAYQYSFPSGQSQLQVPVIPNPQPLPPSSGPVYTNTPIYPHSMPYPQQTQFPPPQQIPPSVHYGYQQPPPPTYPPPHIVSNNNFPSPIPPQHWTQPPAYQMPPSQFPQQYNYLPNNPPSMPYPIPQHTTAPFPSYPPNSNTLFSSNYLPQDPNRSTFTTNTNNPNIYQPSWPNPQPFPVGEQPFPQQDSSTIMKEKTHEDDKLQDENVSEHHEDTFDDHFVDSSPSNSFEISDINDQQSHDISQSGTHKYLL